MRLYLAGCEFVGSHPTLGGLGGLDHLAILTSYWYIIHSSGWDLVEWCNAHGVPLFLDCGAFSALTLGVKIDISEYIDFCKKNHDRFAVMASLDSIGNWRETLDNHDRMRQAGLDTIPTFHVREPFSALEHLLSDRANDYIALGVAGMQRRRRAVMSWLTKCFLLRQRINPECRFHGFALTSADIMALFPWHSVDSSTWMVGRKFGEIIVRDGQRFVRVDRTKFPFYVRKHAIPSGVLPDRTMMNEDYFAVDRWNSKVMLDWVHSLKVGKASAS